MRHFSSVAAVVLFLIVSSMTFGQGSAQNQSVTNYQIINQTAVTATQFQVTYRADLVNPGVPFASVTAKLTTLNPFSFRTISGEDFLTFAPVPANSQVTSSNTFTILVDRTVTFSFNNLEWTFTTTPVNPVANPGQNATVAVGSTAMLNGSGSTNPSGVGTLTYAWAFVSRPAGSSTTIANRNSVMASFVVDVKGTYVIQLTVNNGVGSGTADVTISTTYTAPVANPGLPQTVIVGSTVLLNGSGSTDVDGQPLTYAWTIMQSPAGSNATLTGANTVTPSFVADEVGAYTIKLIVNDGMSDSMPSDVTVTSQNVPPVANAGQNQVIAKGATVQLNGSGSTDENGLPLSYSWSLITLPAGSGAMLSNPNIVNPTFVADVQGTYVAQLIVTAGGVNSTASTVTITSNTILPPVASAGNAQMVTDGTVVTLHGTASDPQNYPLTFQWTFLNKPPGSTATLTNATSLTPTFTADLGGPYVVQLIANNGFLSSTPSTVLISTTSVAPIANPGPNQSVTPGTTVTLTGSASSDSNHQPLTYSWTLLSAPPGSNASLSGANTVSPNFIADMVGAYVVQLIVNDGYESSIPVNVMVTASTMPTITLSPNPLSISNAGGVSGTLTLTLSVTAGVNGQIVHLLSNNPTIASVPATILVGAGGSSASIAVTPGNVGTTSITAAAQGLVPATATVNVITPAIVLALDSPTVGLSKTINGTITLNAPAPFPGVTVNLGSSPSGTVDVEPPSVKVATGTTTGSFTVTGLAVGGATITAGSPGYTTTSIGVNVSNLGQINLPSKATVGTNQTVPLQLSLSTPAGAGGVTVMLMSSDTTKVTVPASVTIAQGATAPATQPVATGVNFGSATITASANGLIGATESITVSDTLSFSPATLTLATGATMNLNLTLSSPAPAGLVVNLSSDNINVATVPASLSFPANATSLNVPVTAGSTGMATIHASSANLADTTASVNVATQGSLNVPSSLMAGIGQSVAFPVSLPQAAPTTVTVMLMSNSANATVSPAMVTISAGQTTPSVQPQVTGVNFGSATITASASGYASGSGQVQVIGSLSFAVQTSSVTTGAVQNLVLLISPAAPATGVVINLSSSNTAAATVPATVMIAGNASSVNVPVSGIAQGSATIHASSLPNLPDTTTSVTVTPPIGSIGVQYVTLAAGQSAPLPITLSTPTPADLTVTLQSGNTAVATISPASIVIPAGQTTPGTQPQVTGVSFGPALITASGAGFTPGSTTVQVTGTLAFNPPMLTVNGTSSQNLTLTLSGHAPLGGVTINLSSSNTGVATVPSTVNVPAGATSVQVPVTGVSSGTATIHASSLPNLPDTTAAVTVTITRDIFLPANVIVSPGTSVAYPVTSAQPAPAGGIFVTLSVANSTFATLSTANVFIPAGATTPSSVLKLNGINFGTTTVTASAFGLIGDTETVTVADILSYFPNPIVVNGTNTLNVSLGLSAPAPAGGLTVNVKTDDPTVATVPATVHFNANATSVTLPVTGVSGGTTTVHASNLPNVPDATAPVTVLPPGMVVLPSNVTLTLGQSTSFPVMLSSPAPVGGVTVMLMSTDTTKVTISPASVTVSGGQTQPTNQPSVTGLNLGTVTINAVATGYVSANQPVKVAATINFVPASANIIGSATTNLALNLSAPAPAGLVINLSSSPAGVVTTPASVTFATGATSVNVPVTGAGPGETTVTASTTTANVASTTASITVAPATPASITINGGATQSAAAGAAFGTPLAVTVKDGNSAPVPGTPVIFTAIAGGNGQSGTFSNGMGTITVNTNANGVATAGTFTANGKLGSYTVTVAASPAPNATFNLTNNPGAATHYLVTGPANATGGIAFNITVTAQDSFNNTATGYAGTVHFTSSDGLAVLPGNSTLSSGVGTFPVTLKTAGTQSVTATDTVTSSINGAISIPVVTSATHFSVSAPASPTAGTAFNFTVTALDGNNATAAGYSGTVHFTSSDGAAVLPANSTLTNGVGNFSATLKGAGVQNIIATDTVTPSITGVTSPLTVQPAAATHFVVAAPSSVAVGAPFNITVTAQDQFNNTATTYGGTIHFTSTDGSPSLPGNATLASGVGIFSVTLNTPPSQTVTATDTANGSITGTSSSISVVPGANHFSVSAPSNAVAGSPFNFTVTALSSGNMTVAAYSGTVHFTSSDGAAVLPANMTLTNGVGMFSATLKTVNASQTITATDTVTAITGTSGAINVGPGTATKFAITGAPSMTNSGAPFNITVTAQDAYNNTATTYGGTVRFTSTDGTANLPSNSTLTNGVGMFSVTLNAFGNQTVTATDTSNGSITGTSGTITVARTATHFSVTAPSNATAGLPINFSVTALDSNNITVTTYTGTVHFSSNDPNGAGLPANTTLSNGSGTFQATLKKAESNTTITATDTVNASITGTSSNINVAAGNAAVIMPFSGTPQQAQINQAYAQSLVALVTDAGGNPLSGVTVTFTAPMPGSGASGLFLNNSYTVGVMTGPLGTAAAPQFTANSTKGSFTVTAAAGLITPVAMFSLKNISQVVVGSTTVGENLESSFLVTIPTQFASAVCVVLTSSDSSRLFLYGGGTAPPAGTSFIVINAGNTQGIAFAEGQGGGTGSPTVTGTLNLTYTPGVGSNPGTCTNPATTYDPGMNTINVTNSGFVISEQSGNGIGASFNATLGIPATLVVNSAMLDASGNFVAIQAVHHSFTNSGGTITQNPVIVSLGNTNPNAGTVPASVTFNGGDTAQNATFNPVAAPMSTTVSANSPGGGFTTTPMIGCPSSCMPANSLFINVPQPTASLPNVSVGNGLQGPVQVNLGGVVPGNPNDPNSGINITVSTTSSSISLSTIAGGAGASSIQVFAHAGQEFSNVFYVNGLAATGSATFTAMAPNGFGNATATANLTASSIVIAGPSQQQGAGILTTPTGGAQNVYLFSEQVTSAGAFIAYQPVANAQSVTVVQTVTGTFSSPVIIAAGTGATQTTFTPTAVSSGSLTVTEPGGFIAPQGGQSIPVQVITPGISCSGSASLGGAVTVGSALEVQGSCGLGEPPPPGGVMLTLHSQPGLLISLDPTQAGSSTLNTVVGADGVTTSVIFYLQAVNGGVGTAVGATPSYTATASGFNSGGGSISVANVLPYVGGPNAFSQDAGFQINVPNGTMQLLTLYMALVDGTGKPTGHQALAGGLTLNVNVNNTNPTAGNVTPVNPVAVNVGIDGTPLEFNAAAGEQGQVTTITAQGGVSSTYGTNIKVN